VPLDDILTRLARLEERLARQGSTQPEEQQSLFAGPAEAPVVESPPGKGDGGRTEAVQGAGQAEEPAPAAAPKQEEPVPGDGAHVLERVRSWAHDNDGVLFAALGGGAAVEGNTLVIAPGFFKPEDLRRRAAACLEALGLGLGVRLAQAGVAAPSQTDAARPATLQDVYDIFGKR
jgi:hypothetical protein